MSETTQDYGHGPDESSAYAEPIAVDDEPAPPAAFAGRDDGERIDELVAEIGKADAGGIRELCRIVMERMDRGDLSSLAALQLLRRAKERWAQLEQARS